MLYDFLKLLEEVRYHLEKNKSWTLHLMMLSLDEQKWLKEIPFINFPNHFQVQMIPSNGALIRFRVRQSTTPEKHAVSIYLDAYEALGIFGEPYWEIYPVENEECARCPMNDTNNLLKEIQNSLDWLEKRG